MDNTEAGVRRRRKPIRFSLAALLVLITVACVLLAIFRPIRPYTVVAALELNSGGRDRSPTPLGSAWIEQNAMAAPPLVTSDEVINSALASPKVAGLGQIRRQPNAAAWLRNRLRVKYLGNGKIIEFRLPGQGAGADDDLQILQAVLDAYRDVILRRQRLADPAGPTTEVIVAQELAIIPESR